MAIREIKHYPDSVLAKRAKPVAAVDDEVCRLIDDMFETMYAAPGVGLAAPQVGVSLRVIVMDAGQREDGQAPPLALVNPEITLAEGEAECDEGCLSVPGLLASIERYGSVTVSALDRNGEPLTIEAEGIVAIILQHEIDHLDGITILDRVGPIKRSFYKKRLKKSLAKAAAEARG